jgi:hypothetical protein
MVITQNPTVVPHRVAPEGVAELKAQVKAKFHMYCFVLW